MLTHSPTTNSKPPPSRIRLCLRAIVLGCLPLFAVCAQAGEAKPVGPDNAAASELTLRDCRLTLNARRALREEAELASLNLGVSVRNGVATLWGSVTSADLAQQAVRKLRQVPGLSEVRDELSIVPPEELPLRLPRGQPPRAEPLPSHCCSPVVWSMLRSPRLELPERRVAGVESASPQ